MKLVIVESPTKAKTITKYLPKEFIVESSLGHIRDLPKSATEIPQKYKSEKWARVGIDVEHDFAPLYIVPKDKKKHVAKLKQLIKKADEIYLATDEDREGEAISWHLLEVLQPTAPVHRMVFHEITKAAIEKAMANPREVDMNLVEAQETRRVLDRLYGYEISPILWRKVAPKLSAGRVQSAALRLIVNREKERMAFHSAMYWDIAGNFKTQDGTTFEAKLVSVDGKRVATGKDFDGTTGSILDKVKDTVVVLGESTTTTLADSLTNVEWNVSSVQQKPLSLSPKPPFITSTLQQEAGHKFHWSARSTMRVAQKLYELGFITYMRTDSVQLSDEAKKAAADRIVAKYGQEYFEPRVYANKSKNAQEAHEAIRPAGTEMRPVSDIAAELDADQIKLYDLIWKRTMASQMSNAKLQQTTAQLVHDNVVFQASGRVIEFPGYLKVYVAGSDDPDADATDKESVLPPLQADDKVTSEHLSAEDHATKAPARYTEASLVKQLESDGVGRPSTYATIIDTIQRRGYVYKDGSALIPRFVGFGVVALLHNNFPNLVDTEYTAAMEEDLDAIANGSLEYLPYLKKFYFGKDGTKGLHEMLEVDIDARATCTIPIGKDEAGRAVNVRVGRYGPFVEQVLNETEQKTASIPDDLPPDQLTVEKALEYISKQAEGPTPLGVDPETNQNVFLLEGRFGPYVQLGDKPKAEKDAKGKKKKVVKPKMKGLLKGMQPADVNLDIALQLLSFPKSIGVYEKTGEDIIADLGRFGPYLKCGEETRSLSPEDNILETTLERATIMFDTPKLRGARARVLRDIGNHPADETPIKLYQGRYGPYIKYKALNVSVPDDINIEKMTVEEAVQLIAAKEAQA